MSKLNTPFRNNRHHCFSTTSSCFTLATIQQQLTDIWVFSTVWLFMINIAATNMHVQDPHTEMLIAQVNTDEQNCCVYDSMPQTCVIGFLSGCSFPLPSATHGVQSLHTVTNTCACLLELLVILVIVNWYSPCLICIFLRAKNAQPFSTWLQVICISSLEEYLLLGKGSNQVCKGLEKKEILSSSQSQVWYQTPTTPAQGARSTENFRYLCYTVDSRPACDCRDANMDRILIDIFVWQGLNSVS